MGGLMKNEVRDIARIAKLPSAQRKDSQGICFLGKINYNESVSYTHLDVYKRQAPGRSLSSTGWGVSSAMT